MTDTSACGRIEFHILWCRDCVSLIRSRFHVILKFSFHHSSTKFPFNRVSNQNWFLGHDHARLTRLVLRRAICSRINRFRLDLFRCCKSTSCCNLDSWVKNKKIKREDYKSHSFSFKHEHFMRGFRIWRQFD